MEFFDLLVRFCEANYFQQDSLFIGIPEDTHINLLITSSDVLHSAAVPSVGVKLDACPGRLNSTNLFILRKGIFYGQCSEICGVGHSFMPLQFFVYDPLILDWSDSIDTNNKFNDSFLLVKNGWFDWLAKFLFPEMFANHTKIGELENKLQDLRDDKNRIQDTLNRRNTEIFFKNQELDRLRAAIRSNRAELERLIGERDAQINPQPMRMENEPNLEPRRNEEQERINAERDLQIAHLNAELQQNLTRINNLELVNKNLRLSYTQTAMLSAQFARTYGAALEDIIWSSWRQQELDCKRSIKNTQEQINDRRN